MEWRKNAGYIITNSITIGDSEIVFGVHEKTPNSFVTWECSEKTIIIGDITFQISLKSKRISLKEDLLRLSFMR